MITLDLDSKYRLGPAILEMASNSSGTNWKNMVHGIVSDVANQTGETTYLSLFEDGVVFLDIVLGHGSLRVVQSFPQADEDPLLHARSSGKLYLSTLSPDQLKEYLLKHPLKPLTNHTITTREQLEMELARIQNQGFSQDNEEYERGVICYSYPFHSDHRVIGTLSVSYPTVRSEKEAAIQSICRDAAGKISNITPSHVISSLVHSLT